MLSLYSRLSFYLVSNIILLYTFAYTSCFKKSCQLVLFALCLSNFKFPKVVLAHILGEVGTFCTVLSSFPSRKCLPFFIKIGSYLTGTEQNNKLAHFKGTF